MRLPAVLGLVAAMAAWTSAPANAQASVSYPPSRSLGDLAAWLQRDTPISPGQVVDISPSAVTAVTSAAPMGETRGFLANIASEAVDPEMLAHDGVASWSIPVEIDCEKRQVRLGAMTGYRSRDLHSDAKSVRAADTAWVSPTPSAPLGAVLRALCDRDFRRPLSGHFHAAAKAPEPAKPASKHEAPPPTLQPALAPTAEPTKARKAKASADSGIAVQVGASPSRPDIEGLLARFKKKFAGELRGRSAKAATIQVNGKTVNRALISGFASTAEANGFCKKLAAAHQACFVRR